MKEVENKIGYATGYAQCVTDLVAYLNQKTKNGTVILIPALDIAEEFVGKKIEENTQRYSELATLLEAIGV